MGTLDVDRKILDYLGRNPGTNASQTANAVLRDYSAPYARDRIKTLIARGRIRAEVSASNRYRLFVADDAARAEAIAP